VGGARSKDGSGGKKLGDYFLGQLEAGFSILPPPSSLLPSLIDGGRGLIKEYQEREAGMQ
jgi:hypothetical protein